LNGNHCPGTFFQLLAKNFRKISVLGCPLRQRISLSPGEGFYELFGRSFAKEPDMGSKWRTGGLWFVIVGCVGLLAGTVGGVALPEGAKDRIPKTDYLIVHEWGTFLSVQGSDGTTLGGMVDSEEDLPVFVRERSLGGVNRACLNQKVETPVTYFYTDRPRTVTVRAEMPRGILTHWYPHVRSYDAAPAHQQTALPGGSYLDWDKVELIPDGTSHDSKGSPVPQPRPIPKDSTWGFVRQTDSALVKVANARRLGRPFVEYEKFLFYRGLGVFDLPLEVRDAGPTRTCGKRLSLRNRGNESLPAIVAVEVEKDTIRFAVLDGLAAGASRTVLLEPELSSKKLEFSSKMSLKEGVPQVKEALVKVLVKQGLFVKEARAMVNNWEKSYFRTEGLRMLYPVPRSAVDAALPIRITPEPNQLVRVMMGRVEVLTPGKEREIAKAVADLNAKDANVRQAGQATLAKLGRLREPALRRVLALTTDKQIRQRIDTMLGRAK
jgi:hypothetical protein